MRDEDLQKLELAILNNEVDPLAPAQEGIGPITSKALERELLKDNWMMLCFGVAKELGMTLTRLLSEATEEEILGWSCYFSILADRQEKQMNEARRRR